MKEAVVRGLTITVLLLSALPATAATFVAMTEEELVSQSDAIVQGRVIEVRSFWNEGRTAILTDSQIQIEDEVHGSAPSVLTIRTIGGRVGKFWLEANGEPQFQKGGRYLVYLKEAEDGTYRVLGYRLGQFRIRRNQEGLDVALPMAEAGVRFVEGKGQGKVAIRTRALLVDQLKNQIRETAGRVRRPIKR